MPLTQEEIESIRSDAFAEDVAYDIKVLQHMTVEEVEAYFESGGGPVACERPPPAAQAKVAVSGLHALTAQLVDGSVFDMTSLAGKPSLIMNVASR